MYAISSYNNNIEKNSVTVINIENNEVKVVCDVNYDTRGYNHYDLKITPDNVLYYQNENDTRYKFTGKELVENGETNDRGTEKVNHINFRLNIGKYGDCYNRNRIGSYEILFMRKNYTMSGSNSCLLVLDTNKMSIIKKIKTEDYAYFACSSYYQDNKLYVPMCVKYLKSYNNHYTTGFCKVYIFTTNGEFSGFVIDTYYIFKEANYYCHCEMDYTLTSYENLIMYHDEDNKFIIFDYVNNKVIISTTLEVLGRAYSFVKINNENDVIDNKEFSLIDELYFNKTNADVEIETIDGIVLAHKLFLITECDYFKKMLSGNYNETNKIKLDFDKEIVEMTLQYIYMNKFECESIKKLVETYNLCDEICYEKLKNHVGTILFETHEMNEDMTKVKISDVKLLKELPIEIETIVFDKNFNKSIDGLIPNGIKKLVFGMEFNKGIKKLPDSVISLEFGLNWNMHLSDIPDQIESISLCEIYNNDIIEYPKKLKTLKLYKSCMCKFPEEIKSKIIYFD